jgi:hypothetical protein
MPLFLLFHFVLSGLPNNGVPFNHVSKLCSFMPHHACILRDIPWQLPWSVTILKLQCVAWQDESLTSIGRECTFPDYVWGLPISRKGVPQGYPVFVRYSNPTPSKHNCTVLPQHQSIRLLCNEVTFPLTWDTDVKTSVCSHAQHEKLSSLCTIHLFMLAANQRHSSVNNWGTSSRHFQTKEWQVRRWECSVSSSTHPQFIGSPLHITYKSSLRQACQTEGPPRATWVSFVLSRGPHTTINWSHLIKIITEYFYCLNLETYNVHTKILNKEKHAVFLWTTHVYPV